MSEYKYLNEYYDVANINEARIILGESQVKKLMDLLLPESIDRAIK